MLQHHRGGDERLIPQPEIGIPVGAVEIGPVRQVEQGLDPRQEPAVADPLPDGRSHQRVAQL